MREYSSTEGRLMDAMSEMDIIDAHEHLPAESVRLAQPQDVFTLFSHYTVYDLVCAGMSQQQSERLIDASMPLEQRWRWFEPFWKHIRQGCFARPALLTAKMVYGFDDVNEKTYQALSEKIAAENTPGLYQRIFDRCRIKAVLTQCASTEVSWPLVPIMPGRILVELWTRDRLEKVAAIVDRPLPADLDGWSELAGAVLDHWIAQGVVGIKLTARQNHLVDRRQAETLFARILGGERLELDEEFYQPLTDWLAQHLVEMAAARELVVAVHAGVWQDFRNNDCKHLMRLAMRHPNVTFDLYHLGMPFVRDCIVIGKQLPNVHLNLAATYLLSQVQTASGVDELLDQVPTNKVLAFGGDYNRPVEKIVGHLHMARECLAQVFGRRIDEGTMGFDQAFEIIKAWFYDNVLRLYPRLKMQ